MGNLLVGSSYVLTALTNKRHALTHGSGGVDLLSIETNTIRNLAVASPLSIRQVDAQKCLIGFDYADFQPRLSVPTSGGSSSL